MLHREILSAFGPRCVTALAMLGCRQALRQLQTLQEWQLPCCSVMSSAALEIFSKVCVHFATALAVFLNTRVYRQVLRQLQTLQKVAAVAAGVSLLVAAGLAGGALAGGSAPPQVAAEPVPDCSTPYPAKPHEERRCCCRISLYVLRCGPRGVTQTMLLIKALPSITATHKPTPPPFLQ